MRKKQLLATTLAATLALSGCSGYGQNEGIGTVLGAVAGAVIGSQFGSGDGQLVAVALGTLIGAMVGQQIGRELDERDREAAAYAYDQAASAPIGATQSWSNPESGNYGTVTPVDEGYDETGNYCRTFDQTIVVDGEVKQTTGTACQNDDGSWHII